MLNYTVTASTFQASAGDQVDIGTPTIILTITADPGYTVLAADFSIGNALPAEITSAVFADISGGTVECTVDFAPTFIMPAGDVSLPIDIDGTAYPIVSNTVGTIEISGDNLNPNATSTPYTITSEPGDSDVLSFSVAADAGYHFTTPPSLSFSATQTPSEYSISSTSPTTDVDGNIISYGYIIRYVRATTGHIAGDEIRVVGNAEGIFVSNLKYYSYAVSRAFGTLTSAGIYSTSPGDKQMLLVVYGDVGATITVDIAKNGAVATNVVTAQAITFAGGYTKIVVPMTGAVGGDYYDITLSGDINPVFVQPNPIRINITADIVYDINITPITGYTITNTGITSVSAAQGYVLAEKAVTSSINAVFKVTKDDGATISLQLFPTWANDVSNLDPLTNGGTEILTQKGIRVTGNGTTELLITVVADVVKFGNASVSSFISLTTSLNANPVTIDVAASVVAGDSVAISLTGSATDIDGDPITPVVVTQPIHGTVAVSGFGFIYTHTAEDTNPDQFTYKVTDGYGESNVSAVNITVTGAPTAGITPSGGAGLFRITAEMGATAAAIAVTFDAGVKPGRVELIYDGVVVADSLFVGDNLTDANRTATVADIELSGAAHQHYQFTWVGTLGNGTLYGEDFRWDVTKPIAPVIYTSTDIAPTGNTRSVTSNYGGQTGIAVDALDSADGNLVIGYTKPVGGSSTILVRVHGIIGSAWSITDITITP